MACRLGKESCKFENAPGCETSPCIRERIKKDGYVKVIHKEQIGYTLSKHNTWYKKSLKQ